LQSGLIRRLATAAITLTLLSFPAAAQQGALLDVPLASGSERVWFVGPTNPRAVLIMFVGSAGVVEFGANDVTGYEADNFLVRTQPLWLAQGFAVAILGSPNNGALSGHRHELAYADAIGRAVDFVRTRANAPVWLLGISQGAIAVANGAAHLPGKVTGVVLISPLPGAAVPARPFSTAISARSRYRRWSSPIKTMAARPAHRALPRRSSRHWPARRART
jgi:pimeloyl-ACP methyl ester carboxylesterase